MSTQDFETIFKAYDVRAIYPTQINKDIVGRIGEAFVAVNKSKKVAVGQDVRASGKELKASLIESLLKCGVDVVDIGVITTDQLYFTVGNYGLDAGISVTASHNPAEYNGMKFAERGGSPLSSEGLLAIRDWAASDNKLDISTPGKLFEQEIMDNYIQHVLGYIDTKSIKPMKIVANGNFGAVGKGVDIIAKQLNLELERLNWQEDGTFPKGSPNPMLQENRDETMALIKKSQPDFGVAWDADADRCFFFTRDGGFVPSAFIIALLAPEFLNKDPGAKIVHDVTLRWVVDGSVKAAGGEPVLNRVGHTFIKARMRQEDSPFAAESSGHYYFRDSFYADNGLVPFLLILQLISKSGKSLSELIAPLADKYFMASETNYEIADPQAAIKKIENKLGKEGQIDKTDGVTIEAKDWRINLRPSNTEPLLRLNAEARSQKGLDDIMSRVAALINT